MITIENKMTSRQRIRCAVAHKEADRIPLDFGGTGCTGICGTAYQQLRSFMNLPKKPSLIWHVIQQLVEVDEDILEYLNVDVRQFGPNDPSNWKLEIKEDNMNRRYTDEWGISWVMPKNSGHYFDMSYNPLSGVQTIQDIERHNWPNPTDTTRFTGLAEKAKELYGSDKAILLGPIYAGIFDTAAWLMGYEQCMINIACNFKLVQAVMEKVTEIKCQYWEKALSVIGPYVDVVLECDDLAGQNGPLFNISIYEQYIKPLHSRLFDTIRKHTNAAIFFHCCGSIYDFLPGFIESGVQIINPVQVTAAKMDTKVLKKEFGKDVTFWGGGCDTQKVLWSGSPQCVRDEVKKRIEDLGQGGGFVFSQVHNIQNGVPPENLMAMWETWAEYGKY